MNAESGGVGSETSLKILFESGSTSLTLPLGVLRASTAYQWRVTAVNADVPWRNDVVAEGFTVEKNGRLVSPSEQPGLGIEIDLEAIARHPFEQEIPREVFYRDGSVGDW